MIEVPKIAGIFICPEKGEPMAQVLYVRAIAHVGLEGDRYALGKGTYSDKNNKGKKVCMRQVSFISSEAIEVANKNLPLPFAWPETRRNIVVKGIPDLICLIGQEFVINGVWFRGFEDCAPCKIPSEMASKEGFANNFKYCGGLRAEILNSGYIGMNSQLWLP